MWSFWHRCFSGLHCGTGSALFGTTVCREHKYFHPNRNVYTTIHGESVTDKSSLASLRRDSSVRNSRLLSLEILQISNEGKLAVSHAIAPSAPLLTFSPPRLFPSFFRGAGWIEDFLWRAETSEITSCDLTFQYFYDEGGNPLVLHSPVVISSFWKWQLNLLGINEFR